MVYFFPRIRSTHRYVKGKVVENFAIDLRSMLTHSWCMLETLMNTTFPDMPRHEPSWMGRRARVFHKSTRHSHPAFGGDVFTKPTSERVPSSDRTGWAQAIGCLLLSQFLPGACARAERMSFPC